MKNYVQPGAVVTIPAPKNVSSGNVVIAGLLAGIAGHNALSADPVDVHLEGVWEVVKASAQAWSLGDAIYVTPASGLCTNAPAAGAVLLGVAVAAAANPSSAGIVRLNGAAPAAVFA